MREVLLALLPPLGFDSFEETADGLSAYAPASQFDSGFAEKLPLKGSEDCKIEISIEKIAAQNWNAEWEKNYQSVLVNDECLIRAPFHKPDKKYTYDLVIEPKMSFGTGHHSTTRLMCLEMLTMDFAAKKVLDMGCGTGVLAILAEKLGAEAIDAIDVDEWACVNTKENLERNNCKRIHCRQGDATLLGNTRYDVILANINRNILLTDMTHYLSVLLPGGHLLLSGFFTTDMPLLLKATEGMQLVNQREEEMWCMLHFQ